jgi:UDP-N-acetylmuramoyl-L-alanyl-D-glutamate--2,6-diaminopimelate ligase
MWAQIDFTKISLITADSRNVKPDSIFVAIKGQGADGHDYIERAIQSGAKIIVAERDAPVPDGIKIYKVENTRLALSQLAACFYGAQPENIVAVTGTNGKSSIVTFTEQIWQALGHNATSLGTLSGGLTSPDPLALHEILAERAHEGVTHLALEASSHGLHQHRLDSVNIKAAGFTNLSHDHLDYHADMDEYLSAKSRLFSELLSKDGVAVLNADTPEFEKLASATKAQILSYGWQGRDLKIVKADPLQNGIAATLEIFGRRYDLTIPLIGAFQLSNLLCALGLSFLSAQPDTALIEKSVRALETIKPARGRLQPVYGHPEGASIYIDYAHTPDALETVLKTLRPHTKGRLVCVVGCGGDRDKTKRPLMGRIAFDNSESVIITDDNPRNEKPVDIRKQVLAGIPSIKHNKLVLEIGDRAAAIDHSIQTLKQYDTLVIAGKGHESGQSLESRIIIPFDDYEQAVKAIENMRD